MSSPIARVVMSLAERLAPPAHASWSAAMRAEFEALGGGPGSTKWALGCLVSATGWRARAEAGWVAASMLGCASAYFLNAQIFFVVVDWAQANSTVWFNTMQAVQAALLFALCFALVAVWPRRAWLIGGVVPMVWLMGWPLAAFVQNLRDSLNDPLLMLDVEPAMPFIAFPFWWLAQQTWAGVLGAIFGWSLWRVTRGRAARLPATSL
ncbi:hypothetical protein ASG17_14465 [Brevundimonas sp. Leaf363]|uniref:hypothetical protein n=1 Tax=Brevundimonas sp. Leaf363 TaxID=1736353 RepID=UPI0006FE1F94|nr:hypothetical protein [Brevundimonas sp. Leaf363]KQS53717.1 hypothetical protein ASG17_14465 [Brevundimonas sp. Leaf363]